jgi:hypothetical protein
MKTFLEPEKAIKHIFSTQYLTDELGADWTKDIPEMAMLSAQKLYSMSAEISLKSYAVSCKKCMIIMSIP